MKKLYNFDLIKKKKMRDQKTVNDLTSFCCMEYR